MSDGTKIQWSDASWNPIRGCSKISPGCENCYAMHYANRFKGPGLPYEGLAKSGPVNWTGKLQFVEEKLDEPLHWKRGRRIFVNSMSDLFHENVRFEWIDQIFSVMSCCPQHTFQILTKRAEIMAEYMAIVPVLDNVWLGVSVENADYVHRIETLRNISAAVRFVSYEPMLGPLGDVDLSGIDWLIAGGESGPKARVNDLFWHRSALALCRRQSVFYFEKQLGSCCISHGTGGWPSAWLNQERRFLSGGSLEIPLRDKKGGDMSEFPVDLRVREFPTVRTPVATGK